MKVRYKLSLLIIGLMLVGCLYITQSYALWIITEEQTNENEMDVGCFSIGFSEQSESIKLDNTYPVNDSIGLSTNPYTFTITNTCTINNNYVLTLNTLSTNTLDASKIKYALYKSSEEKPNVGSKLSRINTDLENLMVENLGTSYILDTGVLSGGTKVDGVVNNGEEVTYNLYLWIDDIAGNEVEGQTFEASINVINAATESNDIGEVYGSAVAKCGAEGKDAVTCMKENANLDTINLAYDGKESLGEELGTDDNNLRYIGANPNNYVLFNGEKWRIIGVMKVKNENGEKVERLKIIRTNGISGQENLEKYYWDNKSSNDWTISALKDMLNGIYYNSTSGECYTTSISEPTTCDFTQESGLVKGINSNSRSMIDTNLVWNVGGVDTTDVVPAEIYKKERGIQTGNNNQNKSEWSKEIDNEFYNGIGLMYPSDYGYAVGKSMRNLCINNYMSLYYTEKCGYDDWLKPSSSWYWTITASIPNENKVNRILAPGDNGVMGYATSHIDSGSVAPVVYLINNIKIINGNGTEDNPFILEA